MFKLKTFLLIFALLTQIIHASEETEWRTTQVKWAKKHAKAIDSIYPETGLNDMRAFGKIIGSAKVVGFGESAHATHQQVQMRVRLLEYLVKEKGFTAIAMESGFVEGQMVNDFVLGLRDDLREVLENGFTYNMGLWEETESLVQWMRQYNLDPNNQNRPKVHFYGMDLTRYGDVPLVPLQHALKYLNTVDPEMHNSSFKRLYDLAKKAHKVIEDALAFSLSQFGVPYSPDYNDGLATISYDNLSKAEKGEFNVLIQGLVDQLRLQSLSYIEKSGKEKYDLALQMANYAKYLLRNLNHRTRYNSIANIEDIKPFLKRIYNADELDRLGVLERSFTGTAAEWDSFFIGRNGRELTLLDNLKWIQQKEKKVFVVAHNGHLAKAPIKHDFSNAEGSYALGEYLAKEYSQDYVVIGSTMNRYVEADGSVIADIAQSQDCENCFEKPLTAVKHAMFVIDLRNSKVPSINSWLNQLQDMRYQYDYMKYTPLKAFDAIFYTRDVQRGTPIE